jgi:hypothetical protein
MNGGSSYGRCWEFFLFTTASRPALGPIQTPIQWVPGALSLGIKRPGREADLSPPYSAILPLPQCAFTSWRGARLKHRDTFSFYWNMWNIWGQNDNEIAIRNRAIPQDMVITQLVKKPTAFYGTSVFITIFTRNCHWHLFWATWIQSTFSHSASLTSTLLLSSHLHLLSPNWSLPFWFFRLNSVCISSCVLHVPHMPHSLCQEYLVGNSNYKAPHRVFLSIVPLLHLP